MPTLTITNNAVAGQVYTKAMINTAYAAIETFINTTKLDGDNIQIAAIADDVAAAMSATGANTIASTMTATGANAILADVSTFPATQANLAAAARTRTVTTNGTDPGAGGVVISASSSSFSVGTTMADVTNLSVTLTTSGRPVEVRLISDGSGSLSYLRTNASGSSGSSTLDFKLFRGATEIAYESLRIDSGNASADPRIQIPTSSLSFVDAPTAGTYTYKIQAQRTGTGQANVLNCKLMAYEL